MNKKPLFIIIGILIFVIIIMGIVVIFLKSDSIFLSKEDKFKKYIAQNFEYIGEQLNLEEEKNYYKFLTENDYKEEITGNMLYQQKETDQEESLELTESGIVNNSQKKFLKTYNINYDEDNLVELEFMREDNIYGIRLANLVKQFVSIENNNLKEVLIDLGINNKNISDKINLINFDGILEFSDDEIKTLQNTYINLAFEGIDEEKYTYQSENTITIGENSIEVKSYTLTLTNSQIKEIKRKMLKKLSEDSIILQKVETLENSLKEAGINMALQEKFQEIISNKIEENSYSGEDTEETKITVYVSKGKTVRTEIKNQTQEIRIDLTDNDGKTIELKNTQISSNGTNTDIYKIGTQNGNVKKIAYSNDIEFIELNRTIVKNGENYSEEITISYNSENTKNLVITLNKKTEIGSNEITTEFSENNNILLNDYDKDKINSIINSLEKKLSNSLKEKQTTLKLRSIEKVLNYIATREVKNQENAQNDIAKFNNQFELYAGEEISSNLVKKLISVAGKNLKDYEVVSGKHIKLNLQEGTQNIEMANTVSSAISDEKNYDISFDYTDNGLIKSINIMVHTKKD